MAHPPPHNHNGEQPQHQPNGLPQFMLNPYLQGHYYPYPLPAHYHPHYGPPGIPAAPPQYQPQAQYPPAVLQHPQYQGHVPLAHLPPPVVIPPPVALPPPVAHQPIDQHAQGPPPPMRICPNVEARPGVFRFKVEIIEGNARHDFEEHTDTPWTDFRPQFVGRLENPDVELVCKVTSGSGGATQLKTQDNYDTAIEHLLLKVQTARTKAVGLEIRNIARPAAASKKAGKRKRDEDIPPKLDGEQSSQLKSYKILKPTL